MNALIVEDIFLARRTLKQVLEKEGFSVEEVERGSNAIGILNKSKFDYIFIDLGLPDMDGIDLIRQLRDNGCASKIIVTSGQSERNTLIKCMNAGADNYLVKPIDYDRVRQLIDFE